MCFFPLSSFCLFYFILYIYLSIIYFLFLLDGLFLILQSLNWEEVAKKTVAAPFVPRIIDELDVSNFSEEFTGMAATDSPAVVPPNVDKIFKVHPSALHSLIYHSFTSLVPVIVNNTQIRLNDHNRCFSLLLIQIGIFLHCTVDLVHREYY